MTLLFFTCAKTRKVLLAIVFLFFADAANAQVATLKINSDLLIHPAQMVNVFAINADRVNKAATWDWPELQFQAPYKTFWSGVQAKGPFTLNVHTDDLTKQELSFELYWQNPLVTVNQFVIHDQIVRDYGGAQVIINLDGQCTGMDWKVNNGLWKVRGKIAWAIVNQQIQASWKEFQFINNPSAAAPVTNIGQCQGPPEIQIALRENIQSVTGSPAAMQDLLQRGILAWMNKALNNLTGELLKVRSGVMRQDMDMLWEPQFMVTLPGGILRVPGYVTLRRQGISQWPMVVDRTLVDTDYQNSTESGFILPKNTMEAVVSFMYSNGDMQHRYKSTEIKGFTDLMNNRTNQSYVWPDLQKFSTSTLFYFDLRAATVPQLSGLATGTVKNGGGIVYVMKAPIAIDTLAPTRTEYLPYVDFTSTIDGLFRTFVKSGQVVMRAETASVPLKAKFRSEYKAYRKVDETIDTARLGTAGKDFINGKVYNINLPKWNMNGMSLQYSDLHLFRESVILPMSFVKSN